MRWNDQEQHRDKQKADFRVNLSRNRTPDVISSDGALFSLWARMYYALLTVKQCSQIEVDESHGKEGCLVSLSAKPFPNSIQMSRRMQSQPLPSVCRYCPRQRTSLDVFLERHIPKNIERSKRDQIDKATRTQGHILHEISC
jgi:hypothetical protein